MNTFCWLDFETYGTVYLRKVGAQLYAEHPDTGIHCIAFIYDETESLIKEYQLSEKAERWQWHRLRRLASDPSVVFVAHNAEFEQAIWREIMVKRYGFPEIPVHRWKCTMAKCFRHGLLGQLGRVAKVLKLQNQVRETKGKNMLQLAKPRKPSKKNPYSFWREEFAPQKFADLYEDCLQDTRVTKELDLFLPELTRQERKIWLIDQKINQRGLYVDLEACEKAVQFIEIEKQNLKDRFAETGCTLKPTQRAKMQGWFAEQGFEVPNTQKATLASLTEDDDLPQHIADAIELMASANKSSLAKYPAFLRRSSPAGLLCGAFAYHGAHTGRWAGRGVQLQNLPRPKFDSDVVVKCLKAMDYDTFTLMYDDVNAALSTALRGMIIPEPGFELFVADLKQMEARCMAWQAGDQNKIQMFLDGVDTYKNAASILYNVPVEDVDDEQRFSGKLLELSAQYQGGIHAVYKIGKGYGVNLRPLYDVLMPTATEEEINSAEFCYMMYLDARKKAKSTEKPVSREVGYAINIMKDRWRKANKPVVEYWNALNRAACFAVMSDTGESYSAGSDRGKVTYFRHKRWLCCRLPSGRVMYYYRPEASEGKRGKLTLKYFGPKGWTTTYGGKLAENVTQAIQRDLLSDAICRIDEYYSDSSSAYISGHVHDEIITSVKIDYGNIDEYIDLVKQFKPWANGIPIDADGFRCMRYKK